MGSETAADIPGESESTWKYPNQSHEEISSYDATGRKSTIKGKKRALEGKEEEEEEDKVKDRGRGVRKGPYRNDQKGRSLLWRECSQ